jgi:protein-S-isoprenylcysteine O-methyltransferase Ste14
MYSGALVMLLGIPLALASWWGLIAFAIMVAVIVIRLLDEEKLLLANLPGYAEYVARVRYRLMPSGSHLFPNRSGNCEALPRRENPRVIFAR